MYFFWIKIWWYFVFFTLACFINMIFHFLHALYSYARPKKKKKTDSSLCWYVYVAISSSSTQHITLTSYTILSTYSRNTHLSSMWPIACPFEWSFPFFGQQKKKGLAIGEAVSIMLWGQGVVKNPNFRMANLWPINRWKSVEKQAQDMRNAY